MLKYIASRFVHLIIVLIGISFLTFSLTFIMPSDPITMMYTSMNLQPDKEVVEAKKEELGLNKPFIEQYINWTKKAVRGDFGTSFKYNVPVTQKLKDVFPNTLKLVATATIISIVFSIMLGVLSAVNQNTFADSIIRFISFVGVSMPSFWLGMLLIYRFSIKWKLLPSGGMGRNGIILPAATLGIWMSALYIRRVRTAVLEELDKDYVKGLLSKGIGYYKIVFKHILPNAMIGLITMLGMSIGAMLGGSLVIETIFSWKGVGLVAVEAIKNRDYPLIQGYVLWMAIIFVVINFIVDISYNFLDPRIRIGEKS